MQPWPVGSVDWSIVLYTRKGCGFNSRSGHVWETTDSSVSQLQFMFSIIQCYFVLVSGVQHSG